MQLTTYRDSRQNTVDEFLTAKEVAAELRCSKAQVYKLINGQVDGVAVLPYLPLGRRKKVVPRSGFEAWKRQTIASKIGASELDTVDAVA